MRSLILAVPVCALLAGAGYLHGLVTDRWSPPPAKDFTGQAAAVVPLELGDWQGENLAREVEADRRTTVVNRTYKHRHSGQWVLTSVTTGRPGIVSVHNPEHCYLGSGYKLLDTIRAETLELPGGQTARFWTGHFQKKRPSGIESIRIYWGWASAGTWEAPNYPRLVFAAQPKLHKLYMIHPVPPDGDKDDSTAYRAFMTQYVHALNQQLGR